MAEFIYFYAYIYAFSGCSIGVRHCHALRLPRYSTHPTACDGLLVATAEASAPALTRYASPGVPAPVAAARKSPQK